jgi:hypothetical protein
LSSTVEVKGGKALRVALRKYDKDLAKEVNQEMASYLKPIVRQARSYLPSQSPLSSWGKEVSSADTINYRPFPRYNGLKARRGVGYTTTPSKPNKKGFIYFAQVFNSEAGGAIYETAGRKNPNGRRPVMSTYLKEYGTTFAMEGNKRGKKSYNSNNPFAGYQFVNSMPALYQVPRKANQSGRLSRMMNGRVIFRAWAETNGQVTPKIIKAMEKAKVKFDSGKSAA